VQTVPLQIAQHLGVVDGKPQNRAAAQRESAFVIFDSGEAAGQLGAGSRSTIAVVDRDLGRPRFGVKAEPAELGWPESGTCRAARR
jgi:hypothetical protein